jgi:hypothetical protein
LGELQRDSSKLENFDLLGAFESLKRGAIGEHNYPTGPRGESEQGNFVGLVENIWVSPVLMRVINLTWDL